MIMSLIMILFVLTRSQGNTMLISDFIYLVSLFSKCFEAKNFILRIFRLSRNLVEGTFNKKIVRNFATTKFFAYTVFKHLFS